MHAQVNSLWIYCNTNIIAESQIASEKQNKNKERQFVKTFVEQIIEPSKLSKSNRNETLDSAFTIYIKKRQYLFHVLYDADLTFLSLTINTIQQQPVDAIFDLLYTMQSSLIFEGGLSFTDNLSDLHHSYRNTWSATEDMYTQESSDRYCHDIMYSFSSVSPSIRSYLSRANPLNRTDNDEDEKSEKTIDYFILKKGWMKKMGDTLKTWKCRYFELWSNGLLNYFETELKIKKKGSLNIPDEVLSVDLDSNHGFMLSTNHKIWHFMLNKERVRNDWFLLIQLITFGNVDINGKLKAFKVRLEKLEFIWESQFEHIEYKILNGNNNEEDCNIYQLQYDLKTATDICTKCNLELSLFCGSDIFSLYSPKLEDVTENMGRVLSLIEGIIHSRNETPLRKRKRRSYLNQNRESLKKQLRENETMMNKNGVLLDAIIKIRLPSKKWIGSRNSLSKKTRVLHVTIEDRFFKVNIERENTAPLVWKFDEILRIDDIKGVYFGKKKTGAIRLKDIQQFQITVLHFSNRRLQLIFDAEKEAYVWFKTLQSLYEKSNQLNVLLSQNKQIGL